MNFLKEIIFRPAAIVWGAVTGGVGLVAFLGIDSQSSGYLKMLIVLCIALGSSTVALFVQAANLFARAKAPVRIRTVVSGDHFYQGTVVIILDKSNWIEPGQILTLVQSADEVQTPLALLRVETFTTERYPQCVLLVPLTTQDLAGYLADRSRWKSITVLSEIKAQYLEGVTNA